MLYFIISVLTMYNGSILKEPSKNYWKCCKCSSEETVSLGVCAFKSWQRQSQSLASSAMTCCFTGLKACVSFPTLYALVSLGPETNISNVKNFSLIFKENRLRRCEWLELKFRSFCLVSPREALGPPAVLPSLRWAPI